VISGNSDKRYYRCNQPQWREPMPREGAPSHHRGCDGESETQIPQLNVDFLVVGDAGFTIAETAGVFFRSLHRYQL